MKILVDISLGGIKQGLSGIPQDSRWLFKTLTELRDSNVSGLVYDTDFSSLTLKSLKGYFNQTQFFAGMFQSTDSQDWLLHKTKWKRVLYYIYSLYYKQTFDLVKAHEYLKPLIYRKYLAKGNIDYKIMMKDFYLYSASLGLLVARTQNNLKSPKIKTKGWNFAIFQDVRGFRVSKGTRKIIRYHDSIPITDFDVMDDAKYGSILHYRELQNCINDGSIFVTNSDTVNKKLIILFPELNGRTFTINYAISDKFYPEKKEIGFKYILHVATIEPRKNQINMIKAFKKFNLKYPEYKLVMVGQKGWKYEEIEKEMMSLGKDLLYIDGLTPDELRVFYSNAELFCFPSFNEGFGLPPIEAMACGCPVLSSDIDVHKEIQKDAATYCDPYDPNDIAEKMIYIISNPEYAKSKVSLGLNLVKRYSNKRAKDNWFNLLTNLYGKK